MWRRAHEPMSARACEDSEEFMCDRENAGLLRRTVGGDVLEFVGSEPRFWGLSNDNGYSFSFPSGG